MTRKIFLILLAVVLALSVGLVGCAGEQEEEEEEPLLTLTFSDHNPGGPGFNPIATAMQDYAAYIEDASDGQVAIECHYLGSLYSDVELFDAVKGAACDGGSYAAEIGDGFYYHQVMSLPFMGFPTGADAQNIYWEISDDFPEIQAEFTDNSCMLGPGTYFMMPPVQMHYYAENLVIDEPAEADDLQMIVLEGVYAAMVEPLGISVTQLGFPDLVPAFQTEMGDGYIQHSEFLYGAVGKEFFHSHTLFEGGICRIPMGQLWNKASYEACLNIVGQQVMDEAGAIYLARCTQGTASDTANILQWYVDQGDTVTSLDAAQTAAFRDAVVGYHDDWIAGAPDPAKAQAIYDAVLAAIAALAA